MNVFHDIRFKLTLGLSNDYADPAFTLRPLLKFLYSLDGRIRSAASASVLSVLKGQSDQTKAVIELLDCAT
jgi:hypothetical protein